MRAPYFLAILLALVCCNCSDIQYPEKPDDLIAKDTMVNILTDAYLSTASKSFNRTILSRAQVDLENYIYKKYKIDSTRFQSSNMYYTANLDEYREMIQQVKNNIDQRLAAVDSTIEKTKEINKREKDSLRALGQKVRDSLGIDTDSLDIKGTLIPDHELDSIPDTAGQLLDKAKRGR
jgi:hypothetical protein